MPDVQAGTRSLPYGAPEHVAMGFPLYPEPRPKPVPPVRVKASPASSNGGFWAFQGPVLTA